MDVNSTAGDTGTEQASLISTAMAAVPSLVKCHWMTSTVPTMYLRLWPIAQRNPMENSERSEARDKILFDAAQGLLDLPSDLHDEGGMPIRVVIAIELHGSDGESYIRAIATMSSEWWHSLGLLTAAERILTPGHEPIDLQSEE